MTQRSAPHLALHAEDWEGRTVRMPIPRRLLTAIPADDYVTYENRLVRTVIEDAGAEASRRAAAIARTIEKLERASALSQGRLGGDWARVRRVCELLALPPPNLLEEHLRGLRDQLARLRHVEGTLNSARRSALFRELRAAPPEREVRPTNVLVHDTRYRAARDVRIRLNALQHERDTAPIADRLSAYYHWVRNALDRALEQLGWTHSVDASSEWAGRGWRLTMRTDDLLRRIVLRFTRQEALAPRGNGTTPTVRLPAELQSSGTLLILPVWSALGTVEARQQALAEIDRDAAVHHRVVCVYPGGGDDGEADGAKPLPLFRHRVVAASPALLDSVELLGREILRETWMRDLLEGHPLSYCPACPNEFEPGRRVFKCEQCETRWGIHPCRHCHGEVLVPSLVVPDHGLSAGGELRRGRTDLFAFDSMGRLLCANCGRPT